MTELENNTVSTTHSPSPANSAAPLPHAPQKPLRIGILTGGGDCPGLNAVIRSVVRLAERSGDTCIGFTDGWKGVVESTYMPLTRREVSGILHLGGTILGTSRTNLAKVKDGYSRALEVLKTLGLDALIPIGGDDTLGVARELTRRGFKNIVACPKTIDNDLWGTDYTFGFDTAVNIAVEAIDRLHTTAEAHRRVMVVEVMGRSAGWIALYAGMTGGANVIVIPEVTTTIAEICGYISRRQELLGRKFSIVVVAEGAKFPELHGEEFGKEKTDAFGHKLLGGIGQWVAGQIEERLKVECRTAVLGHIQRGGTPTARDRWLALNFGAEAYRSVRRGEFGVMIALRGTDFVRVPLEEVASHLKTVPADLYRKAQEFFG